MTIDKRNETMSIGEARGHTIPVSETRKDLAVTKSYTSLDITNAIEQVLVAHGYCEKDSYECNSFLMDTLETLGHYKGGK